MGSYVVEGKNISFQYQDSSEGIQDVHFALEPGEIILVTGNSGSGKSTFLKCLNGLIPRVVEGTLQGEILLNDQNTKAMSMAEISRHISSVFQNPRSQFFTTNTTSELVFSMENYGCKNDAMEAQLQQVTTLLKIQKLLNRDIFQLSGGERQMVAIASAMMLGQKIILLDEPSANLDYHNTYVFRTLVEKLKQEGYTVLIADHRFYYLSGLISRVFLFNDGKMQIFNSEELFKKSNYDTRSFDLFAMDIPFQIPSEKKEKQGKSAEEQLIDHVSSHFFDEVVFNDSVKEFMKLRRRLANYFEATSDEDIFNYIPPQKTNQIFTPKKVVRKMVDLLEEENPGCFDDPDKTFADLYMKSGQYITEIVKRLYNSEGMRRAFPDDEERLRHIFKHQVYGLAPTECIYRIALRYILGFDDTIHIAENEHHLRFADSLPAAKAGEMEAFLDSVFKS